MATKTATVLFDVVSWREPIEGTVPLQYQHESAYRGQTVELPAAELKRLANLGAVVEGTDAAEALQAWDASAEAYPVGEEGDKALAELSAPELIAYVTQFPAENTRVWTLEQARKGKARATVARAAGYDPETGELLIPAGATPAV
jgi:hypothetical protein